MSVSEKSKQFHTLGPKDVSKTEETWMKVNVVRTTSHTGEQFHIECPVYATDTREEMDARVGMCLSIIQDRLEEENQAFLKIQQEEQLKRMREEAKRRNSIKLQNDLKKLEREGKKQGWKPETLEAKKKETMEKFETAQKTLDEDETLEGILAKAPKNLEVQEPATH